MRAAALALALLFLSGCGTTSPTGTRAIGEATAWTRSGEIEKTTTTTFSQDAEGNDVKTVVTVETCKGCEEKRAEGGRGGPDFYSIAVQGVIGLIMVLFQSGVF